MQAQQAFRKLLNALSEYDELEAHSIARIVLKDVFQLSPQSEKPLGQEQILELERIADRLQSGEPVQYVTGWADFYGLKLRVSRDVLIPRMETEGLVSHSIKFIEEEGGKEPAILDIGTGSGCIAITIAKKLPHTRVFATDTSKNALSVALANATLCNAHVGFVHHDIFSEHPLPLPAFDLVVSNPPYIPHQETHLMPKHVLDFEPHMALFVPNEDPLVFYKTIALRAKNVLYPGGMLAFECNQYNAGEVAGLMELFGYSEIELIKDLSGNDRIVSGRVPE